MWRLEAAVPFPVKRPGIEAARLELWVRAGRPRAGNLLPGPVLAAAVVPASTPSSYRIRAARTGDGPEFLRLVEELARFEHLDPPDEHGQRRLLRDAFGAQPAYELLVAEPRDGTGLVGYGVVLRTYSSFLGRPTLYLEDLYLSPDHRRRGLGRMFLHHLAALAIERGWGRLEGVVLAWNEGARRFYADTGARELDDWVFFRYDEAALRRLAHGYLNPTRGAFQGSPGSGGG